MILRLFVLSLLLGTATGIIPGAADAQHGGDQDAGVLNGFNRTDETRLAVVDDRGKMETAFNALAARKAGLSHGVSAEIAPAPASPEKRSPEESPGDWYDQGGLQSAYGAYAAAARSFQKAITMAPHNADAHFQLGVVYGELRQFEAAIRAMTRAIDLDTNASAYYYGRGRVYLLAGQEDLAMRDFMQAGFLGHRDAQAYLKDAGVSLE
jgi:tetratricopeptide (TPR) repeat protein